MEMRGVKRSCSSEHGEDFSVETPLRPIPGGYPESPSGVFEYNHAPSVFEVWASSAFYGLTTLLARPIVAIKQYFEPRRYKLEPILQPNGIRPFKKRIVDLDALDNTNDDSIDDTLMEIDPDEHATSTAYKAHTESRSYTNLDEFDCSPDCASTPATQEAWEARRRAANNSPSPSKRASNRAIATPIRRIPMQSRHFNRRKHSSRPPMGSPDIWMSDEVACPDDPFVADNIFEPKPSTTNNTNTPTPSPESIKSRKVLTPQSVRKTKIEESPDNMRTLSMSYKEKIAGTKTNEVVPTIEFPETQPGTNPLFVAQFGPIPAASGPDEPYENDLSELPDAPTPPAKKKVGWAGFAHAKPFFIDSTTAEMQDSFLEELKQGHDFETALANATPMPASDPGVAPPSNTGDEVGVDYNNTIDLSSPPVNAAGAEDIDAHDLTESVIEESVNDLPEAINQELIHDSNDSDSSEFDEDPDEASSDFDDDPEEKPLNQSSPHKASSIDESLPEGDPHGDNELDESIISRELAESLLQEFKASLQLQDSTPTPAKAPPTVPAVPTIPPLISPLTDEEEATLEAKSKECDQGKRAEAKLTESRGLGRASLTAHDFSRLLPALFNGSPMGWLNDEIINEYLAILVRFFWDAEEYKGYKHTTSGPSVDAMSSYWYKQQPAGLKRWFSKKNLLGQNFLRARLILLPICHQSHWRLAAIKPREKRIIYLDSLSYPQQEITDKILEALPEVLGDLYVPNEWTVEPTQQSIQQDNASDCGVFTLLNALVLVRGEEHKRVICVDGMMDARRRIAITLLAGEPTGEVD
ncbi:cysteine proteinase [Periconia macrospinosa]|uniref:Cysteine proteinase n=1 Tax=Periconia macrospinosa TaxID=97972 RepID=A0A2V1DZ72_9PLEO|nr:cysteine proteinase [Periconia macrospinosa]